MTFKHKYTHLLDYYLVLLFTSQRQSRICKVCTLRIRYFGSVVSVLPVYLLRLSVMLLISVTICTMVSVGAHSLLTFSFLALLQVI